MVTISSNELTKALFAQIDNYVLLVFFYKIGKTGTIDQL